MSSSTSNSKSHCSATKSRGNLPWAFLGMVVCIALIEWMIAVLSPHATTDLLSHRFYNATQVPTLDESIVQWQIYNLFTSDENPDLLFLGDSSCLMGVVPQEVKAKTGLSTLNLGTIGSLWTEGHAEILELFLKKHRAPQYLVYYITDYPISISRRRIEEIGFLARFNRWIGTADTSMLSILPSFRLRGEVPGFWAGLTRAQSRLAEPRGPFPSDDETRQILTVTKGHMSEPRVGGIDVPFKYTPEFSRDAIPGLTRMLEITKNASIRVILVMNPLPESARVPETERAFEQLQNALQEVLSPYKHVRVFSPFLRFYPVNQCSGDCHHLIESGAVQNSQEVGEWIAKTFDLSPGA